MHGSQVSLAHVSSVKLMSRNDFNTNSGVIKIDNHTKYSIVKRDDKDRSFYGYNPHYGWNKLSPDVLKLLSTVKVKKASLHFNIEIKLNVTGNVIESINNESLECEQIMIPPGYQQRSYDAESGCVWMSTCLSIRSKDSHLDDYLLETYSTNSKAYEWLHIHMKSSKGSINLASFFST